MLNHAKVAASLEKLAAQLFVDERASFSYVQKLWKRICVDDDFSTWITQQDVPWSLPTWQGNLDDVYTAPLNKSGYQVVGVDGSQIFPDRHRGIRCFLLNMGTVLLRYGICDIACSSLDSQPYLYVDYEQDDDGITVQEWISAKREALEFSTGIYASSVFDKYPDAPSLVLFDGSLVFWHLQNKSTTLRKMFLHEYLTILTEYEQKNLVIASYISAPKSKEITNLIRAAVCTKICDEKSCEHSDIFRRINDAMLVRSFLQANQRTTLFKSTSSITSFYPPSLHPHFVYLNTGSEIARVEIPAYCVENQEKFYNLLMIIFDQIKKGYGYPIALSEAHEQAVVKAADRDFFFYLIAKYGVRYHNKLHISQKQLKKRRPVV